MDGWVILYIVGAGIGALISVTATALVVRRERGKK